MAAPASLNTLAAEIVVLLDAAAAAIASLEAKLASDTWTVRDLLGLRASIAGLVGDVADVRAQLDAADVTSYLVADSGERRIQLWQWERATRSALVTVRARLAAADAIAGELVAGQPLTRHAVRTGETLQSIAAVYLGDWREWPKIAASNGLPAGTVAPGTMLIIPAKA